MFWLDDISIRVEKALTEAGATEEAEVAPPADADRDPELLDDWNWKTKTEKVKYDRNQFALSHRTRDVNGGTHVTYQTNIKTFVKVLSLSDYGRLKEARSLLQDMFLEEHLKIIFPSMRMKQSQISLIIWLCQL